MRMELISIPTPTGQPLDGAFYDAAESRGAIQLLHGNAMNFYVGHSRFLPPALTAIGFTCLAYNRRGHGTLTTRNSRNPEGNAFATVEMSLEDNVLARSFLEDRGFFSPIVIGHSNGGMLGVRHVADHPDTPALVLMSAHRGGKTMIERASRNGLMACDRYEEMLLTARRMVAEGKGEELMLFPGWWHVMTAKVFCDQVDNLPDVLDLASLITCPVLYIRGDREPQELYPAEQFAERCGGKVDIVIVPNCDHFYNGVESYVAELVADWLQPFGSSGACGPSAGKVSR
ncbi:MULTISPECIES: alpha/beta hydrolase [Rhizobium/Agrobacterium group]|uniref:alpha/beta hydrolase n=1 Tax=Rhizobium/Agrobacterium group TaxID=227290 RepID=UPI001ADA0C4D|nr:MULTISPECIES: alpha/beta hydrolase [Rhizobium/Agrobacterium group]MBO9112585.1 alpha/beta hydrolase [Agrobacterium sp. S2/73]QXZ76087.1 alpha/beta hydrolase [Agrobacterium sp. S7/73]QYA16907.1 alpha/beta hydrolase [Rhizobium sp. AB2/73]UEQ85521.1 alpha/beta hydrolase [Rhizobium sp. AB2/73]